MYSGGMCTLLRTLLLILFVNCTPPRLNCFQENIIDLYGEDTNLPTAEMIIREEAKRIGLSTAYFDTCSGQWTKKNASVVVYFRQCEKLVSFGARIGGNQRGGTEPSISSCTI